MAEDKNILDLQDLFGQANAIKVKTRDGKMHGLVRLDGISPRQAVRFQTLQLKASKLQSLGETMNDDQANELEGIIDELLGILCNDLPLTDGMTFIEKVTIMQFYMEQTQGKKKMDQALQRLQMTGAKRSRK